MADEKLQAALGRIERALALIEAAAATPPPATTPAGVADEEHERLLLAHAALRDAVGGAVARIDALVQSEERA